MPNAPAKGWATDRRGIIGISIAGQFQPVTSISSPTSFMSFRSLIWLWNIRVDIQLPLTANHFTRKVWPILEKFIPQLIEYICLYITMRLAWILLRTTMNRDISDLINMINRRLTANCRYWLEAHLPCGGQKPPPRLAPKFATTKRINPELISGLTKVG